MRESGILMHITSLPAPYGIGTMGKDAYAFVDFLVRAGQRYWQILPLTPTGYGDSPLSVSGRLRRQPLSHRSGQAGRRGTAEKRGNPEHSMGQQSGAGGFWSHVRSSDERAAAGVSAVCTG